MNDTIELNELPPLPSVNSGGGLEFFMNESKGLSNIRGFGGGGGGLNDVSSLEQDLNSLVGLTSTPATPNTKEHLFSAAMETDPAPSVGKESAGLAQSSATWDGYEKYSNKVPTEKHEDPKLSKEEMLREKFRYLRLLEDLQRKGINLSRNYTMDSNLAEMMGEYETLMEERSRANSIKFQANMLKSCIFGIEFLNKKFDPFDVNLDGWSDQYEDNISDYDDVFGSLYEKYKSKASIAPELKLLFMLGGSAMWVHMSNQMLRNAPPGVDEIMRQNPELMRNFQEAAMKSMAPGVSGFMSNMGQSEVRSAVTGRQGPPPPLSTKDYHPEPMRRPGNNNDFSAPSSAQPRPEMTGPGDLSDILSGLKTKKINIQTFNQVASASASAADETMSLTSAADVPKRSGRRKKPSASNTVSLDI
jgi:hypothetical protein